MQLVWFLWRNLWQYYCMSMHWKKKKMISLLLRSDLRSININMVWCTVGLWGLDTIIYSASLEAATASKHWNASLVLYDEMNIKHCEKELVLAKNWINFLLSFWDTNPEFIANDCCCDFVSCFWSNSFWSFSSSNGSRVKRWGQRGIDHLTNQQLVVKAS